MKQSRFSPEKRWSYFFYTSGIVFVFLLESSGCLTKLLCDFQHGTQGVLFLDLLSSLATKRNNLDKFNFYIGNGKLFDDFYMYNILIIRSLK